ncbi:hypothetical protein BDP27DRAFT_1445574 [Rhodocollybia butyracea]|uniref:Uncharacterized protein n=1 Tax=Rhodocollybia butyracea TaxID=206335 RepID=A0A9P5PUD4_9AGAR|nr:hypothetical protein BDP27DRAFT_1445574 [Rhodocollybia butyracea]
MLFTITPTTLYPTRHCSSYAQRLRTLFPAPHCPLRTDVTIPRFSQQHPRVRGSSYTPSTVDNSANENFNNVTNYIHFHVFSELEYPPPSAYAGYSTHATSTRDPDVLLAHMALLLVLLPRPTARAALRRRSGFENSNDHKPRYDPYRSQMPT